eukprot:TRINITY_DN48738_c0_g1_i1.p1 TRINITY_DN48738_c0_g1~~TRINITY_DN48738_c0_g1_i1.p1  ORF type:complete len:435 (+),score=91.23 TRINITY_DN48738_c0_g1_i1:47-1306(+)
MSGAQLAPASNGGSVLASSEEVDWHAVFLQLTSVILAFYFARCCLWRLGGTREVKGVELAEEEFVDAAAGDASTDCFGRYKYCGLRDDPFASSEAPKPCATPFKIRLPALTREQEQQLSALTERVADLEGHRRDPSTLLRFLRARKYDVAAAEKQFRQAIEWRQQHDIDRVFTHWNLEAFERCLAPWWLSGGLFGHGRDGQPIAYERLGRCNFPKLAQSIPFELLLKLDIVHCERSIAALEEDCLRRGVPLQGVIVVMDLDGFGFDQVQFSAARTLSKLVESRTLLLTEITGKALVVRAPPAAARAWSLFSNLLDPGTAAKVEVVTVQKTPQTLRKYIDDVDIPAFLGGSKCVKGDPECRTILAPGGLPPPAALANFSQQAQERQARVQMQAPAQAKPAARAEDWWPVFDFGCNGCRQR